MEKAKKAIEKITKKKTRELFGNPTA
jgi:hypothetical protein